MHCANKECGAAMVPRHHELTDGVKRLGGQSLCVACYSRLRRNGSTDRYREYWSADELLDEYVMIRDSVTSIRQAAERMGVKFSKLDMALYRARKRGDDRGNAPLDQIDRAIQRGQSVPIVRRHQEAA